MKTPSPSTFLSQFAERPPTHEAITVTTGTETFTRAAPGDSDADIAYGSQRAVPESLVPIDITTGTETFTSVGGGDRDGDPMLAHGRMIPRVPQCSLY